MTRILALWGVVASGALLYLWSQDAPLPKTSSPPVESPAERGAGVQPSDDDSDEAPDPGDSSAIDPSTPPTLMRHDLCQATDLPVQRLLDLAAGPLMAVHCGSQARVVDFASGQPTTLLEFDVKPLQPGTVALPSDLASIDVNGDGARDLVVATRFATPRGAPSGGSVHLLPHSQRGGYLPPRRLLSAHALRLIEGPTPEVPLIVAHGQDTARGQSTLLWNYMTASGGQRQASGSAPEGAQALLLALSRSGPTTHLLWSGAREGRPGVIVQALPTLESEVSSSFLPLGRVVAGAVGGVRQDGEMEVLLAGDALHLLRLSEGHEPLATPVPGSACPEISAQSAPCHRDPQIIDVDGDGRNEFKSYVHPELRIYSGRDAGEAESLRVITLQGDHVAVVALWLLQGPLGLLPVAIVQPAGRAETIELATLPQLDLHAPVLSFSAESRPLKAAPLATHDQL